MPTLLSNDRIRKEKNAHMSWMTRFSWLNFGFWIVSQKCHPCPAQESLEVQIHPLNLLSIGPLLVPLTNRLESFFDLVFGQGFEGRI
jgi:hypothetical protein